MVWVACIWSNCSICLCLQVSGKLIDKEQTLEEEIQLRERMQLQWKQAERTVDDLHMELQTANQAKEDMNKQLKQAQVHTYKQNQIMLVCVFSRISQKTLHKVEWTNRKHWSVALETTASVCLPGYKWFENDLRFHDGIDMFICLKNISCKFQSNLTKCGGWAFKIFSFLVTFHAVFL